MTREEFEDIKRGSRKLEIKIVRLRAQLWESEEVLVGQLVGWSYGDGVAMTGVVASHVYEGCFCVESNGEMHYVSLERLWFVEGVRK